VRGLLALYDADGQERWLAEAVRLTEEQYERLEDTENGGFFLAVAQDDVLFRSKEIFDGALPSANGLVALNLLELARLDENRREHWLDSAERVLRAFGELIEARPAGTRTLVQAVHRYHAMRGELTPQEAAAASVAQLVQKASQAVVKPRLTLDPEADEDGYRPFRLEVEVRAGWHLYANDVAAPLVPTRIEGEGADLRDVAYPESESLEGPEPVRVFFGTFHIEGRTAGSQLRLHFQPCDDSRCLVQTSILVEATPEPVH